MPKLSPYQVSALMTKKLLQDLEIESNSSNPTYQIDIDSGVVGADDGTYVMEVSSPITVDITNTGANGRDTGSEASSTWYYIYVIYNPTSDTTAGLFSTSSSSPTMPSGYTKKRFVGAAYNDSGSDFMKFIQHENRVFYTSEYNILTAGTSGSWTPLNISSYAPPALINEVSLNAAKLYGAPSGNSEGYIGMDGSNYFTYLLSRSDNTYVYRHTTQFIMAVTDKATPNIYYYVVGGANGSLSIFLNGFVLKL